MPKLVCGLAYEAPARLSLTRHRYRLNELVLRAAPAQQHEAQQERPFRGVWWFAERQAWAIAGFSYAANWGPNLGLEACRFQGITWAVNGWFS
jgi:hypothetical protein